MTDDHPIPSRDELLADFDASWNAIQHLVESTSEDDLTTKTDAAGWTAKDHLAHLNAWERGVLGMLRDGRPQWDGMGISRSTFEEEGYDDKNESIRQQSQRQSLSQVVSALNQTHHALADEIRSRPWDDVLREANAFVPGAGDFSFVHKIIGNGPEHVGEHLVYIRRILQDR